MVMGQLLAVTTGEIVWISWALQMQFYDNQSALHDYRLQLQLTTSTTDYNYNSTITFPHLQPYDGNFNPMRTIPQPHCCHHNYNFQLQLYTATAILHGRCATMMPLYFFRRWSSYNSRTLRTLRTLIATTFQTQRLQPRSCYTARLERRPLP